MYSAENEGLCKNCVIITSLRNWCFYFLNQMMGDAGSRVFDFLLFCCSDPVGDFLNTVCDPHICSGALGIIGFCVHIDTAVFAHFFYLLHGFQIALRIDGKSSATIFLYQGKSGNITRTICDIDHIFKMDTAAFFRDL